MAESQSNAEAAAEAAAAEAAASTNVTANQEDLAGWPDIFKVTRATELITVRIMHRIFLMVRTLLWMGISLFSLVVQKR